MTFAFNQKPAAAPKAVPSGQAFLAQAKAEHDKLFEDFVQRNEDYASLEDFMAALQSSVWQLCEEVAKASFGNGIARGRADRSK